MVNIAGEDICMGDRLYVSEKNGLLYRTTSMKGPLIVSKYNCNEGELLILASNQDRYMVQLEGGAQTMTKAEIMKIMPTKIICYPHQVEAAKRILKTAGAESRLGSAISHPKGIFSFSEGT